MRRVVLPMAAGIALAYWFNLQPVSSYCMAAGIAFLLALLACAYLVNRKTRRRDSRLFRMSLALFFVASGIFLFWLAQPRCSLPDGHYTLRLSLRDNPQPSRRSLHASAELDSLLIGDRWVPAQGRVMLYFRNDSASQSLQAGSRLQVNMRLRQPQDTNYTPTFNYRDYIRRQGISLVGYVPPSALTPLPDGHLSLRCRAQRLQRQWVARFVNGSLSPSHQSVAAALLLGWRDGHFSEIREQYTQAGIVHLLCVSGLHVGLLAYMVGLALRPLGNRRWQRLLRAALQLAALWFYAFITGLAPATCRAALMFSFFVAGNAMQRRSDSLNTLFTSAFFLLLFNPMLLFNIGFQYSYLAMTGILVLMPIMSSWVKMPVLSLTHDSDALLSLMPISPTNTSLPSFDDKRDAHSIDDAETTPHGKRRWLQHCGVALKTVGKQLWDLACLSLSAQLLVLPLTLYYFQQFPTYFLIANMLVIPFAALLLMAALGVVLFSFWPWLAALFAAALNLMLSVVDGITLRIGSMPYAVIEPSHFTLPMLLLSYAAILLLISSLHHLTASSASMRIQQ